MFTSKSNTPFERILNIGITEDLSFFEIQKSYLFNLFVLTALPFIPVFLIINLIQEKYGLFFLNLLQISLYLLSLLVSYTRKWLFLRELFVWVYTIIYFVGSYIYHNGNEYFAFSCLIAALIVFDKIWVYLIYCIFCFTLFVLIKIDLNDYSSLSEGLFKRSTINMISASIVLAFILYFFKSLHFKYQSVLETSNNELDASRKEKEALLKNLAHDLRSPISGINSVSKILLKVEPDHQKKEFLQLIEDTSSKSIEFINEILQIDSSNDIQLTLKEVNLRQIVERLVFIQMSKIEEKQLSVKIDILDSLKIKLDEAKIDRVISNLLHNAIKFSNNLGCIQVSANELDSNGVMISVKDTGIGIPENLMKNLFIFNTTSKRNGTSGEKSYGFGLAICKQLVEAHKGTISVFSKQGEGAVFNIKIPVL